MGVLSHFILLAFPFCRQTAHTSVLQQRLLHGTTYVCTTWNLDSVDTLQVSQCHTRLAVDIS